MAISVLFGKGKSAVGELKTVKERLEVMERENQSLSSLVVKQNGVITTLLEIVTRIDSSFETVLNGVADIKERTENIEAAVFEQVTTHHIGKKPVLLESATEEVDSLTVKEIRAIINRAANRQQKGYSEIYAKVAEITGVDIYAVGKTIITKADGLGFVNPQETYLNTLFKKDVHKVAAAIALDKIRNK